MKIFLDCGAWEGNSIVRFRELYPDHKEYKIYAFEPGPTALKKLRVNFQGVEILPVALWTDDCERTLRTGDGRFSESSTLIKAKRIRRYTKATNVKIQCIDFSKWVKKHCEPEDHVVCKLNIEGAEYKVLSKMLEEGTDKLINEWWIEWHWSKMDMPEAEHKVIADRIEHKNWSLEHQRKAVYTVITDSKYKLNEPHVLNSGWDHICFTNIKGLESEHWTIKMLEGYNSDNVKLSRKVKILHENYLPGYNYSIYLDTRFTIKRSLDKWIRKYIDTSYDMAVMKHNRRGCLYSEAEYLMNQDLVSFEEKKVIRKQVVKYQNYGLRKGFGLWAPGIMYRRHGVSAVNKLMRVWYQDLMAYSSRDQLSLAWAMFKVPDVKLCLLDFKETYGKYIHRKKRVKL